MPTKKERNTEILEDDFMFFLHFNAMGGGGGGGGVCLRCQFTTLARDSRHAWSL